MKNKRNLIIILIATGVIATTLVIVKHFIGIKPISAEITLVRVGDKTISLNEFLSRAEYTMRPQYCSRSDNISKKIVLNSLIAEKMMAIEAGDTNDLMRSEHFQRYIEGRKQQAMRQWLYHKEGYEKAKVNKNEMETLYRLAGRKYHIRYYNLLNDTLAEVVGKKIKENAELFDQVYFELTGSDTIPIKEVDYNIRESEIVHKALFSKNLNKGEVIGPLKTSEGNYLLMRVDGWIDSYVMTETDIARRWNDVKEELIKQKATQIYEKYVAKVMQGKRLDLYPDTFNKLVEIIGPYYFANIEKEKELFLNQAFDKEVESPVYDINKQIEEYIDRPLFRIDGKIWTVRDFSNEVEIHPLVFRNRKMPKSDFAKEFKLAIVDMVRDKYLAEAAYKKGYDKVDIVRKNVDMWQDASVALYHKNQYLSQLNPAEQDPLRQIQNYLNPYVDSLQQKYSAEIEVNVEEFDKINLTRVAMLATQSNVPFPVIVPSFPQNTMDHNLDYGRKMETRDKK